MAQVYDPEDLKEAEERSSAPGDLSTSASKSKVKYSTGAPKSSGADGLATSTSPGNVNYDSSPEVPESEKSLYNSSSTVPGRARFGNLLGTRRRKLALGGGFATVIVSGIFALFFVSGPLQLIHASQILQQPFSRNNSDSSNRLGRLYRYSKTGNIGETRVGFLGSKIFGSTIDQLKEIGVDISTDTLTNTPTETKFNTDKLKLEYPQLEGMSDAEKISFLTEKMGVAPDQITGSGSNYKLDQRDFSVKTARFITKNTVAFLDDGKIIGGIKARELDKFFGLPSLFHPFSRILADRLNGLTAAARQKALEEQQQQERAKLTADVEAKGDIAVKEVQDENGSLTSRFLTFTGGVCLVYSTAGDIITINRDRIVLPAALTATSIIAKGAQAQDGNDLSESQVGAVVNSFTGKDGKNIWQGQALDALANGGKSNPSLTDLPSNYKTAFSGDTTAASIKSAADSTILAATGGITGAGGKFGACGTIGTVTQVVITIAGSAIAAFGDVASEGALTPGLVLLWGAKEAVNVGETGLLLHFVQSFVLGKTTAKLASDAFSGPVGGDLLAYGARDSANIVAVASGGVSLGNKASTLIAANEQKQEENQFKSESLVKRLFDPYDYRSAISKLIDNTNTQPLQNLPKVASIFTGFGSMFTYSLSLFAPHAKAADTPYNWGFSQYGLPDSLLNDPILANPYDNAQYVATNFLDKNASDTHGMPYKEKIMDCFGADVSNDNTDKVWDMIPTTDVNPSDTSYLNANCNDTDENWHRVIMFVFDTTTMKAAACYQNDGQSCNDLGANSGAGSTSDSSSSGGSTSNGCGGSGKYSALVSSSSSFAGIDQGIDFVPTDSDGFDICAPASGTIVQADASGHHFDRTNGQSEIILKMDQPSNAPSSGPYIYFIEIIQIDSSIHVGMHVNKGDKIGHNAQSPGIEVGWANGSGGPGSGLQPSCGLGGQTPCGTSFNNWILAGGGQ